MFLPAFKMICSRGPHLNVFLLFSILKFIGSVYGFNTTAKVNFLTSHSCRGRCAIFIHPSEKPVCQCDGMCHYYHDCCSDYAIVCLVKIVPEKSTKLIRYVSAIVGVVFGVVLILAIIYFVAINRKGQQTISVQVVPRVGEESTTPSTTRDRLII